MLNPRYNDATMPQWQLDVHTHSDKCKARMGLLEAARQECEAFVARRAQSEAAAGCAFERETWGW